VTRSAATPIGLCENFPPLEAGGEQRTVWGLHEWDEMACPGLTFDPPVSKDAEELKL